MKRQSKITTGSRIPDQFQDVCLDVLREKYAKGDEQLLSGAEMVRAIRKRVARSLAEVEAEPKRYRALFLKALEDGFIPGGRINSAAGTGMAQATLINCFVQPVGDSISETVDGKPGIYVALRQAAETMRRGGGVGYDFSSIRPKGAKVKGTRSNASGPLSYMRVFDQSCATVESAGSRRGAQMGVLRIDHPDIMSFISAKQAPGQLSNFNISVGVTDTFMKVLQSRSPFELIHKAEPSDAQIQGGAYQRKDGMWVYRKINSTEIWSMIMTCAYRAGEPGVLFLDHINRENNLYYCEAIETCNPCGEIPSPDFGSCCLGSLNLTNFVLEPFTIKARFDFQQFRDVIRTAVRMLDNVLETSAWPLPEQQKEALDTRRIGLGYTGLGDALIELGLRYDSAEGRAFASEVTQFLRDTAYLCSIELAKEKGAFPKLDADKYLESNFAKRLPEHIRKAIQRNGIRNSHLLSIAPTGTISLAFADNTSNGIEPAFAWHYDRTKRMKDGSSRIYRVKDHAYRLWRYLGHKESQLPQAFVSALEISAHNHMLMQAAVQPFIDAGISKTVNVPEDYDFIQFSSLYFDAWKAGLKGITTFRPNRVLGSVLSISAERPENLEQCKHNRGAEVGGVQEALTGWRETNRAKFRATKSGVTYPVEGGSGRFSIFIGQREDGTQLPFEVRIDGDEQPRGLTALAITLSMDMQSRDYEWLKMKLDCLCGTVGSPYSMAMAPAGRSIQLGGSGEAIARLIRFRCEELGLFKESQLTRPLVDAMFKRMEPKIGTNGALSWTVDVSNVTTGDDFALFVKECALPEGFRRPYGVYLSGTFPPDFSSLTKSLSLDMQVLDPVWIGEKLRALKDLSEAGGEFIAAIPGSDKRRMQPSTVAYIARLLIHRYHMLGILEGNGTPAMPRKWALTENAEGTLSERGSDINGRPGNVCPECGLDAVTCCSTRNFCTVCGYTDVGG